MSITYQSRRKILLLGIVAIAAANLYYREVITREEKQNALAASLFREIIPELIYAREKIDNTPFDGYQQISGLVSQLKKTSTPMLTIEGDVLNRIERGTQELNRLGWSASLAPNRTGKAALDFQSNDEFARIIRTSSGKSVAFNRFGQILEQSASNLRGLGKQK